MPKHVAPNWSALLKEMRATGMTQKEIAAAVQLSQATVSEMMSGEIKATEYTKGLRIIAAHKAAMKRKPAAETA